MNFISGLFSGNKRLISFLIITLIVLAIPLTVLVSQQQQTTKQRAQVSESLLYFAKTSDGSPIRELSLSQKETIPLSLYFNPQGKELNLVKITFSTKNLILESKDANFSKINDSEFLFETFYLNNPSADGKPFSLFNFTVTAGEKSGNITITKGEIGTSVQDKTVEISNILLSVTVNAPIPTPTQSTPTLTPTPTKIPVSGQKIVCDIKIPNLFYNLSYDPFYGRDPNNPKVAKTDANGWPIPAVTLSWTDGKQYKVWGGAEGTRIPSKEELLPPLPNDTNMSTVSALLQKKIDEILKTVIKPLTRNAKGEPIAVSSPYVDIKIKRGEIYHYILTDTKVANLSQCANTGDIAEGTVVVYTGSCPSKGAIFGSEETAGSDSDCK